MITIDAAEILVTNPRNVQWGTYRNDIVWGASSAGGWHRIDLAGNPVSDEMASEIAAAGPIDKARGALPYFDDQPIFRDVQTVVMDSLQENQVMVRIPRFYYRRRGTGVPGHPYELWISDRPLQGFQIHPAFVVGGKIRNCFYLGAYTCGGATFESLPGFAPKVSITFPAARDAIVANHGTEWSMWNIYHVSAIQMLYLVEFANPDAQSVIALGRSSGSSAVVNGMSGAVYRGINEAWGNVWQMVDGLRGFEGTAEAEIIKTDGSGEYVRTGYSPAAASAVANTAMASISGEGFDLRAVNVYDGAVGETAFGDSHWGTASGFVAYHGGHWSYGAGCGLFALYLSHAASYASTILGVRLAKV